jgi:hypothetical protein
MMEALRSSETLVLTTAARRNIPEDANRHNFVPRSPILDPLMMEAVCFSEALLLTGATRRNIPDDGIL